MDGPLQGVPCLIQTRAYPLHYATTGTTFSKWAIHSNHDPICIALTNDGAFITASTNSFVSFWDTATHKQIVPPTHHPANVISMAISANHSLVISRGKRMISPKLPGVLSLSHFDHACVLESTPDAKETLLTTNYLQQHSEALRTSTEECRLEETVSSHRTKYLRSRKSSQ